MDLHDWCGTCSAYTEQHTARATGPLRTVSVCDNCHGVSCDPARVPQG